MTLDSYLRDLLGGNAAVTIVTDNAAAQEQQQQLQQQQREEEVSVKGLPLSRSWYGKRKDPKQNSRWDMMCRRKSDSAIGKPQRRASTEETLIITQNAAMVLLDEDDSSAEFQASSPERQITLIQTFADQIGTTKQPGQAGSIISPDERRGGGRTIRDVLGSLAPPNKPKRSTSDEGQICSDDEVAHELIEGKTDKKSYSSRGAAPQSPPTSVSSSSSNERGDRNRDEKAMHSLLVRGATVDFPHSLRELPYPTSAYPSATDSSLAQSSS